MNLKERRYLTAILKTSQTSSGLNVNNASSDVKAQNKKAPSQHIALSFSFDNKAKELKAFLSDDETASFEYDLTSIRNLLNAEGYGNIEVKDETLVTLMRNARKGQTGEYVIGVPETCIAVKFELDPDGGNLFAVLEESATPQEITTQTLDHALIKGGFENFIISKQSISDTVLKAKAKQTGRHLIGQRPDFTDIQFSLDAASGELTANIQSGNTRQDTSLEGIQLKLKSLGFDSFFFEPSALPSLSAKATKKEYGQFKIGEKRDASASFEYDEDYMHAYISVIPPCGGRELDEDILNKALADEGVYKDCCDQSTINDILQSKGADHIEIARGIQPQDGTDAIFEALVNEVEYTSPKQSKTGKIDLREIVNFTLIEAGVPLMRRTPAKPGANGRNVKGQVIPAYEGEDTPFDETLEGAEQSPDDPNVLVSSCKGHPVILASGVRVDNTVAVNNVDMSTGNIDYDGSILIKGEVKAGMKVRATGDIIVKGVVTKASLYAKNNITIECGAIGSDPTKDGEESPPTTLKAGGNIQAQYINLADVNAGRDIIVKEYISHCTAHAKHKVLVGEQGGKGRIFGGECYGHAGIFAVSLGANGGIRTTVTVGTPPDQTKQFEQLIKNNQTRQDQADHLTSLLKKYEDAFIANPADTGKAQKAKAIKKILSDILQETKKMSKTIDKIHRIFKESNTAEVKVSKSTFPNVQININAAAFHIRQESKGGIFKKQGQDIRWLNYKS